LLIRKKFQWYRCASSIAIFAWRMTLNYAYSPFNINEEIIKRTYYSSISIICNASQEFTLLKIQIINKHRNMGSYQSSSYISIQWRWLSNSILFLPRSETKWDTQQHWNKEKLSMNSHSLPLIIQKNLVRNQYFATLCHLLFATFWCKLII